MNEEVYLFDSGSSAVGWMGLMGGGGGVEEVCVRWVGGGGGLLS